LIVFAQPIFDFLYRGQYHADIRLLALLGLLPLSGGVTGVLESALFASGRPKLATMSYAVSALVTLTVGWGLLAMNGVIGAGMGLLAASLATAATMGWLFLRSTKLKDSAMTTHTAKD
jgi:O-antigen/teichoic acid export membrane protein